MPVPAALILPWSLSDPAGLKVTPCTQDKFDIVPVPGLYIKYLLFLPYCFTPYYPLSNKCLEFGLTFHCTTPAPFYESPGPAGSFLQSPLLVP